MWFVRVHSPTASHRRSNWIEGHRTATFILVAFGWTGAWDLAYYAFGWWETLPVYVNTFPRQWGLPIAAIVTVRASATPLREWLDRVFQWRLRPALYLGAVLLPLVISNVQPVLLGLGGGSIRYAPPAAPHLLFAFFLLNVVLFGGVEEFGWRGFLQPRFQKRWSVLTAGVAVGVVWWAWHLPLFLGHPNYSFEPTFVLAYTTFVVGASTVLGALVNVTDGGVLPAVLLHATVNVAPVLAGAGGVLDGVLPVGLVVGSGSWWLLTAVLVNRYGRSMSPATPVEPLS
ncbi:MAG: CPBP family intramembrane glutamic endopeptidase [Halolamina sp.]